MKLMTIVISRNFFSKIENDLIYLLYKFQRQKGQILWVYNNRASNNIDFEVFHFQVGRS